MTMFTVPVLGDIVREIGGLASEFIVDKDKKEELRYKFAELADRADARDNALRVGQLDINKEEAKNSNLFVAGWRPAIGWVGAVTLGWTWVCAPVVHMIWPDQPMPALHPDAIYPIILGMLGLGAMRTVEKANGTTANMNGEILTPVKPTAAEPPKPPKPGLLDRVIPDWLR